MRRVLFGDRPGAQARVRRQLPPAVHVRAAGPLVASRDARRRHPRRLSGRGDGDRGPPAIASGRLRAWPRQPRLPGLRPRGMPVPGRVSPERVAGPGGPGRVAARDGRCVRPSARIRRLEGTGLLRRRLPGRSPAGSRAGPTDPAPRLDRGAAVVRAASLLVARRAAGRDGKCVPRLLVGPVRLALPPCGPAVRRRPRGRLPASRRGRRPALLPVPVSLRRPARLVRAARLPPGEHLPGHVRQLPPVRERLSRGRAARADAAHTGERRARPAAARRAARVGARGRRHRRLARDAPRLRAGAIRSDSPAGRGGPEWKTPRVPRA